MTERIVELVASKGLFRGLAKQNMFFHQCIGELVDNAVAASKKEQFRVDVVLEYVNDSVVDVWVADNTAGMSADILEKALQLGNSATETHHLNEHGFGLKNALATLCAKTDAWDIWTKGQGDKTVMRVKGPFDRRMKIGPSPFPKKDFIPKESSTVIRASVHPDFISTVQRRGHPSTDLNTLRPWLLEHLGVHYRGYLELSESTGEPLGKIFVGIGNDKERVKPVQVPFLRHEDIAKFDVELDGKVYSMLYTYGVLNRDPEVQDKLKYYYKGNMVSQGIDIRLGNRVIITRQLETIWDRERDNHFNDFVGELLIPDVPRGVLSTKNDKTDFDLSDKGWEKIFTQLREYDPISKGIQKTEKELKTELRRQLKLTGTDGDVSGKEMPLWPPSNVRLDVYRKSANNEITLYEVKVGSGQPLDLYQLKMYWDGLVLEGYNPRRAVLLAKNFPESMHKMVDKMNKKLKPPTGSPPYKFELLTLEDGGLQKGERKKPQKRKKKNI